MNAGVSKFNKAASSVYKSITSTEKEALSQRCVMHTHTMSASPSLPEEVRQEAGPDVI